MVAGSNLSDVKSLYNLLSFALSCSICLLICLLYSLIGSSFFFICQMIRSYGHRPCLPYKRVTPQIEVILQPRPLTNTLCTPLCVCVRYGALLGIRNLNELCAQEMGKLHNLKAICTDVCVYKSTCVVFNGA